MYKMRREMRNIKTTVTRSSSLEDYYTDPVPATYRRDKDRVRDWYPQGFPPRVSGLRPIKELDSKRLASRLYVAYLLVDCCQRRARQRCNNLANNFSSASLGAPGRKDIIERLDLEHVQAFVFSIYLLLIQRGDLDSIQQHEHKYIAQIAHLRGSTSQILTRCFSAASGLFSATEMCSIAAACGYC